MHSYGDNVYVIFAAPGGVERSAEADDECEQASWVSGVARVPIWFGV